MKDTKSETAGKFKVSGWFILLAILFAALSVVCYQAYQPHMTMWANDSHLGALENSSIRLPWIFFGEWVQMWWLGFEAPPASPTFTMLFGTPISPEMFLKIYTPFTMILLGFSAWILFRQLKFAPMVCVLGGLAAGLNMHCFSNGCWGTGTWNVSIAMGFLAVAAIVTENIRQIWIKASLAGLAAGMGVMEGFDSGAILSIYTGIFTLFFCWITQTTWAGRIRRGLWVGSLVILFAVLIAASTISTLVGTQINGIAQPGDTPEKLFDNATMWSLPKLETLRVIIPGLFGYRIQAYTTPPPPALVFLMPTPDSRAGLPANMVDPAPSYWGKVGEDPHITRLEDGSPEVRAATIASLGTAFLNRAFDSKDPDLVAKLAEAMRSGNAEMRALIVERVRDYSQARFSGNGEYAGVLTALFALFAVLNSWRGASSIYSPQERRLVWFWGGAALFSLVAAWGRFAWLYWYIFHLPFFSTIRNPTKFMHPFTVAWIILAGFGLEAFSRCYMQERAKSSAAAKILDKRSWWQKLSGFDKKYLIGLLVVLGASIAGYLAYAGFRPDLAKYLEHHGFDPISAGRIAEFSVNDTLWFVIIFFLSSAIVVSALLGAWTGARAGWMWGLLCAIMVFDMMRADVPWVRYFDVSKTYSMNEITQFLMDKPYEHRVTGRFFPNGDYQLAGDNDFQAVIHWWLENDFPANDIQSVEIDQAPRSPVLDNNYLGYLAPRGEDLVSYVTAAARIWKLTNTRYLLAAAQWLPQLNQAVSPGREVFRIVKRFNLVDKPGITARLDPGDLCPQISDTGNDALIEYTEALPRAKLYSHWLVSTNDNTTLQMLPNPQWNPDQIVLVSSETNDAILPPASTDPNADPGTVEITRYSAKEKDIQLQAHAKTPAVLLYNDRTSPGWKVWVDGKPADLLRCNYIMRGVFVPAGDHVVEFKFVLSHVAFFYLTWATSLFCLILLFYVCWPGRPPRLHQPA